MNLGEFIYEVTSPEHNPIVREEMAMFSFFGILFLIDTMISDRNYMVGISLNYTTENGNVLII